jgi:hypothetical protein
MPKPAKEQSKYYSQVLSSYTTIVLVLLLIVGIMGVLAFPYYISPLSSGAFSSAQYLTVGVLVVIILLTGMFLMERKQNDLASFAIITAMIIITIMVWNLYGVQMVNSIFHL